MCKHYNSYMYIVKSFCQGCFHFSLSLNIFILCMYNTVYGQVGKHLQLMQSITEVFLLKVVFTNTLCVETIITIVSM